MEIGSKEDKDVVLMTYAEATALQWQLIRDWTPFSDVWALKSSSWVLGLTSGACGFMINLHYRTKLKLGKYGHFSSYLPLVIMPTAFCAFYHRMAITDSILLEKKICPICIETRGVIIQAVFGILYPIVLAPIANYMLASNYCLVRIPILHVEPRKLWQFHMATSKKIYQKVPHMLLGNSILAMVMIYCELDNFENLNIKVKQIEKDMVAKGAKFL